jgi:AraC-like DNA-binding protein
MLSQQNLALRACRLFASTDVEETRQRISEIMQPHELRPIGSARGFQAHMDFLRMPGFGIGTIQFGRAHVDVGHIADYHLLVFCLKGRARLQSARGESVADTRRGVYLAPAHPFRGEFSEDCEQLVIRIDAATMRRHTGLQKPVVDGPLDLAEPALRPWAALLDTMVHDPETVGLLRRDDRVAAAYEQLFVRLLLSGSTVQPAESRAAAPAAVRRAEMFIDAHAARPLCLEDIARAAEVPARTLFSTFRRFRQMTPMQYLRDVRLERVREQLTKPADGATVTAVALDGGFGHFGRFAQDYAARFGEKPSETLSRARNASRA